MGGGGELAPGDDDVVINKTVEVAADVVTLDVHEDEGWDDVRSAWREGTGGAAGVDEELAVLLEGLEGVCVACDQDVAVELPLEHAESVVITPWHHVVAVAETNAELLNLDDLRLGPRLTGLALIELTANDMNVSSNATKIIVHLLCAEIASAENSVDLAGNKKSLELGRDLMGAGGHVHITNHKNQNHCC